MVSPADSLCISGFFPVCCGFFLSFIPGQLCISPVYAELVICYMLLVIQLLRMNGFFPVCHVVRLCSSLSDPWCYLQTPCVSADFFLSVVHFFRHLLLGMCASVQYIQSS